MLGLPLLYSLLQISVGLVTSTADILREEEARPFCISVYRMFNIFTCLTMVASLAVTAGWLFREVGRHQAPGGFAPLLEQHLSNSFLDTLFQAKQTETILGALDTTAWPIRDRHRVSLVGRSCTGLLPACALIRA